LKATLLTLDKTWSGDPAAFSGDLIRGYASFINEFHAYLEPKRLSDVIAKAFTPNKLLAAGRLYSQQNTTSVVEGIAETLRSKYNYKLRDEKLRLKRK
jgi:acyl-homoserine lactone acylase PvdQ